MMTRSSRALAWLAFAFVPLQVWGGVHLQSFGIDPSQPGPQLFTSVGAQTAPGPGSSATAEAAWPVTINFAWIDTLPASIEVNFPDRSHTTLTKTLGEPRVGGWIWTGQGQGCFAVFSRFASVLRGTISCGSSPYAIAHTPGTAAQFLTRHSGSGSGMTADQEVLLGAPPGTPPWAPTGACSGPDTTVDVLVVFSADYSPLGASIWEDAQFSVDLARGIVHNSLSTADVRLAGAARISRLGPGYPPQDLIDITIDPEVLALRDYWAADVVAYLAAGTAAQSGNRLGAGRIPGYLGSPPPGPAFAPYAFTALLGHYATDPAFYVFQHELGHTFGANHARGDTPPDNPTPVEPWAFGKWAAMTHQQAQKNRYGAHDVMSYITQCLAVVLDGNPDNCQMVPFYSNPAVTVTTEYRTDAGDLWTFTTGASHNGAAPADTAAVISEFAPCSAQYRAHTDRIFAHPFE